MPQTLLLADDSVTIQRVIELTFADEDIRVLAVSDGDQAIDRIDADPPDIVLVDVGMPGRSGYEVAGHIKQSPRLQHIPVLLLTGAFEPVDEAKAAGIGCDGVLAKPFEPQLVIARVKELLGRSAAVGVSGNGAAALPAEVPAAAARPAQVARLDSYFAQLDEAFASLADTPPPAPATLDLAEEPKPLEIAAVTEPPEPVVEAAPEAEKFIPVPPLADAFAAMLAIEQDEPIPATAPSWPAFVPAPAPPAAGNGHAPIPDAALEEITRRVLERLTDRVVRETASNVISSVAERLVREEIERIKAAVQ
jgi:CheY-like chemotaxis protein